MVLGQKPLQEEVTMNNHIYLSSLNSCLKSKLCNTVGVSVYTISGWIGHYVIVLCAREGKKAPKSVFLIQVKFSWLHCSASVRLGQFNPMNCILHLHWNK